MCSVRSFVCVFIHLHTCAYVLDILSWDCGGGASFSFYVCVLSIARATAARVGSTGF